MTPQTIADDSRMLAPRIAGFIGDNEGQYFLIVEPNIVTQTSSFNNALLLWFCLLIFILLIWNIQKLLVKFAYLPRAHAQGVKQSVCPSVVVVVVGTKIAKSRVLRVYACCKHNQSIDIGEKLVCTGFEFLKKAY